MLRKLDTKHRKAFINLALENDQKVQTHVIKALEDNRDMQDKVMEAKWQIENEREDINEINRRMNKELQLRREQYEE